MPEFPACKAKKCEQCSATVPLSNLLQGRRYAWIRHGTETYLLQLTKSNKLLLTK